MNKGLFISVLTLLNFTSATYAAPATQSLSPYDVVVPSLNGDPATSARVSGQLYYDVSTGNFKGIDGSGIVKTFSTSNQWTAAGSNIYYSGGAVGIGGAPQTSPFSGLDIQIPATGVDGLIIRAGTSSGSYSAIAIRPEHASGMTNIQGTVSNLTMASTVAINAQGGPVQIGGGNQITVSGPVRMTSFGAGTATFDSSGNISSSSDERLKTDIQPFNTGLAALSKINPIKYKWNSISGMEMQHDYVGFSAQNVQSVLPEGVGMNSKGYLSLQERAIIATLVNSVKELQTEIKQLKAQRQQN